MLYPIKRLSRHHPLHCRDEGGSAESIYKIPLQDGIPQTLPKTYDTEYWAGQLAMRKEQEKTIASAGGEPFLCRGKALSADENRSLPFGHERRYITENYASNALSSTSLTCCFASSYFSPKWLS